jgi:hypothetical protein
MEIIVEDRGTAMPTMRKQMPICGIRSNRSATARTAQHGVFLSDFIVKGSLQDLSHSTLASEIYKTPKTQIRGSNLGFYRNTDRKPLYVQRSAAIIGQNLFCGRVVNSLPLSRLLGRPVLVRCPRGFCNPARPALPQRAHGPHAPLTAEVRR